MIMIMIIIIIIIVIKIIKSNKNNNDTRVFDYTGVTAGDGNSVRVSA